MLATHATTLLHFTIKAMCFYPLCFTLESSPGKYRPLLVIGTIQVRGNFLRKNEVCGKFIVLSTFFIHVDKENE